MKDSRREGTKQSTMDVNPSSLPDFAAKYKPIHSARNSREIPIGTPNRRPKGTPLRMWKHRPALRSGAAGGGAESRSGELSAGGGLWRSGSVLEPPALVAGLDDVAVVGEAIEESCCHF